MRLLIQRVTRAQVTVAGDVLGTIGNGLVVFLAVRRGDTARNADKLAIKLVNLRIFSDEQGKMNLSLLDTCGELLVVSQFTLYADASRGNRPSYSLAAPPELAHDLYELFLNKCSNLGVRVKSGVFRAHMVVDISNDGPVTILCESETE